MNLNLKWIDFNCPNCQYINSVQIIDIKTEKKVFCHNCKSTIQLLDQNASTSTSIKRIETSLKNLQNTLKNFGK